MSTESNSKIIITVRGNDLWGEFFKLKDKEKIEGIECDTPLKKMTFAFDSMDFVASVPHDVILTFLSPMAKVAFAEFKDWIKKKLLEIFKKDPKAQVVINGQQTNANNIDQVINNNITINGNVTINVSGNVTIIQKKDDDK